MRIFHSTLLLMTALLLGAGHAAADEKYEETLELFRNAGESASFFANSHGYAVFPTIGKAGIAIGGARGNGRVYAQDRHIGDTTMTQLSIGFQLGGQAFSQIIFFQDERALQEFTSGNFEFGAQAGAVVVTAAASASAGSTGPSASASGGKKDAATAGQYYRGMATFIIAKGGLMYEASVSGQNFSYTPVEPSSDAPTAPNESR